MRFLYPYPRASAKGPTTVIEENRVLIYFRNTKSPCIMSRCEYDEMIAKAKELTREEIEEAITEHLDKVMKGEL